MTWRGPAAGLVLCVVGMAAFARPPADGALLRALFVGCALGGVWSSWRLAQVHSLRLRHVIGLAILCRLILFPMGPTLSDYGYRYIWDGVVFLQAGISPYAYVPSDPQLVVRQLDALNALLNSPDYFSVYPPVSQLVFALGAGVYDAGWLSSWYVIKGGFLALEALGIACLARVVPSRGVALYALHPIALVEIAGQGHTEGALVGMLGLALWGVSRHPALAGFALAMAGWVKLFPLALAPLLGRRWSAWRGWVLAFSLGLAVLLPANGIGHILESVRLYGGSLDFYSAPFLLIKSSLYPLLGEDAGRWAAIGLSLLWMGGLVAVVLTRDGSAESFRRGIAVGVVAYALASPMQHPWNWVGVVFLSPLLHMRLPLLWIASISLVTYLRYVGLEPLYLGAIAVGWGGGLALAIRSFRMRRSYSAAERASSTLSGDAVSASSQM